MPPWVAWSVDPIRDHFADADKPTDDEADKAHAYLISQQLETDEKMALLIEKILAGPLPTSALKHQWWANKLSPNTSHVQRRAWGDAGYNAFLHAGRRVRFKRVG